MSRITTVLRDVSVTAIVAGFLSALINFAGPFLIVLEATRAAGLDDAQTALTGFGQGKVIATPLQMAMVAAGIANDGVVMNPRLIDSVIGNDLSVVRSYDDTEFGDEALDPVDEDAPDLDEDGTPQERAQLREAHGAHDDERKEGDR